MGDAVIGVVILNYRNWPELAETVRCVESQTVPTQIVVVDNASDDGTLHEIRATFPHLAVIEAPRNGGYAAGMNLGRRHLPAGPVLFATHELWMPPDALERMQRLLAGNVGAVGPVIDMTASAGLASFGGSVGAVDFRHRHFTSPVQPEDLQWLDGGCLLVAEAALRDVGDFDEGFFMYFEDVDFGLRLREAGWVLACATDVKVRGRPGSPSPVLFRRNRYRMIGRNFGRQSVLRAMWRELREARRSLACRDAAGALQIALSVGAYLLHLPPRFQLDRARARRTARLRRGGDK